MLFKDGMPNEKLIFRKGGIVDFISRNSLVEQLFFFVGILVCVAVTVTDASPRRNNPSEVAPLSESISKVPPKQPVNYYGMNFDNYSVTTSVVRKGQTLASLLKPHHVSLSTILKTACVSKKTFNVRRIKAGQPYTLLKHPSPDARVKYLIYDLNHEEYVVFDFESPISVYRGRKNVETRRRVLKGTITDNFWQEAKSAHLTETLICEMADIFSSSIDFRQFHKGDTYKIIYEEKYIRNTCVGTGNIIAAKVTCGTELYQAFRFSNGGLTGYYDEKGRRLERSFLKSPLKYRKITSGFTMKRLHPVTHKYRSHPGIDYAAPMGTPVRSVGDGTVIAKGYNRTSGNYLKINHPGVGISEYLHFSRFHSGIKKNKVVAKGDIIGYVGRTGLATGPHLDLRFMKNGKYVDYRKLKLPDGKPVPRKIMPVFQQQVALINARWEDEAVVSLDVDRISDETPDAGKRFSNNL